MENERVLFTIRELDVRRTNDGNFCLKMKISDDIMNLFNKNKFNLTEREQEVLNLLSKGLKNNEIARDLCVSVHTVKAHVASILQKLEVEDRVQAVIKAISEKLIV